MLLIGADGEEEKTMDLDIFNLWVMN